ncbi:MAG: hypothetical protein DSO02_00935, partial [Hadesarchaea archaeon]
MRFSTTELDIKNHVDEFVKDSITPLKRNRKKKGMMRKFLKTVAGILASGAAFSLSLLLLVRLFGWPGFTPPLMGMLAVAWVAGASAGGKLAGGWAAGISLLLAVGLV